ncbi:hypothetical protein ACS0TY_000230 [Phlomoides rotata]
MGKKNSGNSWLNAVKKAFRSPDEKRNSRRREENEQEEDDQKKRGTKRWIFRRHFPLETTIQHSAAKFCSGDENMVRKQPKLDDSGQRKVIAVAMATTAAAEAAVKTARAAVEIIRLSKPSLLVKEDKAAVVIQTIFRGYLARRALLALKGVVNLQALIRGHNVRKRAKMTLQCIQSLVRVQSLVCDQRRRLSLEATSLGSMFSQGNSGRKSSSRNGIKNLNNLDVNSSELEEIHALIQKAKECSLKQGKTLAHALSQQMWKSDNEDHFSDKCINPRFRKDGNLCNQRDSIKNVEVDTSSPYLNRTYDQNHHDSMFIPTSLYQKRLSLFAESPKTPSSSKIQSISGSPCYQSKYRAAETPTSRSIYLHRMSMSDNSCPLPRPNYMASTASAMARVRPHSTPRLRPSSPSRDQTGSAKKRLSFPIHDEPYYGTE